MNTSGESDKRLIGDMAHEIQELKDRLKDVTASRRSARTPLAGVVFNLLFGFAG